MPRHVFLSLNGDLLPRWEQAFPSASASEATTYALNKPLPELVWLRLQQGQSASEQINHLRARIGSCPCIVLSDIPNDEEALMALAASARGYCNSHATEAVLKQVATVVLDGGVWIGEALMQRLVGLVAQPAPVASVEAANRLESLTARELEVAEIIAAGANNKEIAKRLGITERTVKAHVGAILTKLQVRDRLQLALIFRHKGVKESV